MFISKTVQCSSPKLYCSVVEMFPEKSLQLSFNVSKHKMYIKILIFVHIPFKLSELRNF